MKTNELIKYHERAINLLEMTVQAKHRLGSHCENAAHYKSVGLLALSEKETRRAGISRMAINRIKDSYERLMENFN